jgi:hypothetical protein
MVELFNIKRRTSALGPIPANKTIDGAKSLAGDGCTPSACGSFGSTDANVHITCEKTLTGYARQKGLNVNLPLLSDKQIAALPDAAAREAARNDRTDVEAVFRAALRKAGGAAPA